jgi:hypothetical protein
MSAILPRVFGNVVILIAMAYVSFWTLTLVLGGVGALLLGASLEAATFVAMIFIVSGMAVGIVVAFGQIWYRRRGSVWQSRFTAVAVSCLVVALSLYRRGTPMLLVAFAAVAAGLGGVLTFAFSSPGDEPAVR